MAKDLVQCLFIYLCLSFCLFRALPWHMDVPRLGVEWELQLLAYTTATAIPDPSLVCGLYYSSWQCRILDPLSEARDRTCIFMVPSRIRFHCATTGSPSVYLLIWKSFQGAGPQNLSLHQLLPKCIVISRCKKAKK